MDPLLNMRSHQCLSAGCGVVTREQIATSPTFDCVTNAFRPVVVLLRAKSHKTQSHHLVVTNAFRPVVVLLQRIKELEAKVDELQSPMPFGRLWCCYEVEKHLIPKEFWVTNAFRPVVVLLLNYCHFGLCFTKRHQCLSAGCGVVTGCLGSTIERTD